MSKIYIQILKIEAILYIKEKIFENESRKTAITKLLEPFCDTNETVPN